MKKNILLLMLLISMTSTGCVKKSITPEPKNNNKQHSGLKICPDEWIDNQMPGDESVKDRQYYILKGGRKEIAEFDSAWVKSNCSLEKQVVW